MKELYTKPESMIEEFKAQDILTASNQLIDEVPGEHD